MFLAHLVFIWAGPTIPLFADSLFYNDSAVNLLSGNGFGIGTTPEVSLMPGYSLFLAGIYGAFGHRLWVVYAIQSLLVAIACFGLFTVVLRECGKGAAVVAFATLALFPVWFIYPLALGAEPLLLAVQILFLVVTIRPSRTVGWAAGSGATCGLLTLVKPEFFLWLLLPTILAGKGRAFRTLIVSSIALAVVLSPWVMRNAVLFHEFIPLTTRSGGALWLSAHQPELTEFDAPEFVAASSRCRTASAPKASDDCFAREARRMVASHPVYFVKTCAARLFRTLVGSHTEALPVYSMAFGDALRERRTGVLAVKLPLLAIDVAFVTGGLVGLLLACRRRRYWYVLYLTGTKLAVCAIFFGTARYGLHLSPMFAAGWGALAYKLSRRNATFSAREPETAPQ